MFAQQPSDYQYKTTQLFEFTGSNFQDVGTSADYEPGTGSFTVMFSMVAKKGSGTTQIIAGKGNASSGVAGWCAILGEGYLGFRICGGTTTGNYRASARILFPDSYLNQRVYVSAVVDRATGKVDLFLNGSNNNVAYTGFGPTSNVIDPSQNITTTSTLFLGQRSDAGAKFTGTLESLAIYKRALSLTEIRSVLPEGLVDLKISGISNFMFNSKQYAYDGLAVTSDVESVTFTPSFVGNLSITLNGSTLTSGTASAPIALILNEEKTIVLAVTNNTSNTTETYTFKLKRSTQTIKKVNVFTGGQEGYHTYRIPAIIKAPNGDLLAFCEGRKNGSGDAGNIDMVMKRSTDNGLTWNPIVTLVDFKQLLAADGRTYGSLYGDYTVGNMAPVVDMLDPNYPNGRIIMPFNTNGAEAEGTVMGGTGVREVWFITSADNGLTWSTPKNITLSVSKPNEPSFNPNYNFAEDWRWHAITPGHGIQLKNSKYAGRLVFPSNHSAGATGGTYFSHCFYTDDHGATWKLGENVGSNTNECIAAELSNGNVMINCRNYDGSGRRAVATSSDGGATWKNLFRDSQLPEPVCQGTILYNDDAKVLLFANPASTSGRNNLSVKTSFDDGKTWAIKRTVELADGAYSDLVLQNDKNVGLLYETSGYSVINYAIMNNEWIQGGERTSTIVGSGTTSNPITALAISGTMKNFSFNQNTYNYTVQANNTTSSITITPTATTGIITINGIVVNSGTPSGSITLQADVEEFINVTVTETDKVPVNYILKITRESSANGIRDTKKNASSIKCFPNPTKGVFTIGIPDNNVVDSVTVYDVTGNLVLIQKNSNTINLSNYSNGSYLMKINYDSHSIVTHICINK